MKIGFSTVTNFVAERWVSWLLELSVLGGVAYFAIAETHKTAEQTRVLLAKYDAAISAYAKDKTEAVDAATTAAVEQIKHKADGMTKQNVIDVLSAMKKSQAEK